MSAIDNKQLKAAQAEAATATDTYTHVFKKPCSPMRTRPTNS